MVTVTTPRTHIPDDPLTVGQAAARIGVSREWCRQLVDRGDIRGLRTPLGWLLDADDVERYIARRAGREAGHDGP